MANPSYQIIRREVVVALVLVVMLVGLPVVIIALVCFFCLVHEFEVQCRGEGPCVAPSLYQ